MLSARDSIAAYTYGCELNRMTEYVPATADHIKESMALALSNERKEENSTDFCGSFKRLWTLLRESPRTSARCRDEGLFWLSQMALIAPA